MSNNIATILSTAIGESTYLINKDLDASSGELCCQELNGKCRTITSMINELTGFNLAFAKMLSGESVSFESMREMNPNAELAAARGNWNTSVQNVLAVVNSIAEDDWMTEVTAPWGAKLTKANAAMWVATHAMYHDGQINLIQVANGDTDVHWM